jgi:hypothetical protein
MALTEDDYQVIKARVKQKKATDPEWLAVDDELGPLFEGEQAFVVDDEGNAVNFKIGDGVRKYSELPFFIAYYDYVQSLKRLSYINQTGNLVIPNTFRNNSNLYDIILVNQSPNPITLRIGTTSGGSEVMECIVPTGPVTITRKYLFTGPVTLYISGLTGVTYSIFLVFAQLDESPVVPSGTGGTFKYLKGTGPLPFTAVAPAVVSDTWDLLSGRGKVGTGYENCILTGFPGSPLDMSGKYLVGVKGGQTAGQTVGNSDSTVEISMNNLPAEGVGLFANDVRSGNTQTPGNNDKVARAKNINPPDAGGLNYELVKAADGVNTFVGKSANLGNGVELDIQPDSITTLYFIAIE